MKTTLEAERFNDEQLVVRCRDGDRDAFARIVERYQSLVCALTYSTCGNLQASEDLAQVTFITAWCQLPKLREPSKLKSWLCSIARNVSHNASRRDERTPTAHAEALDEATNISSAAPTPRDSVISQEEEAILWRALGELPPAYREPLVLFYREHQSAADVARALDLSEDAVCQRLSRGRTMLTAQVTRFIEGALRQTTPGRAFTLGVLAALPLLTASAKAATASAVAAKSGATAKAAGLSAYFQALLGAISIVSLGSYVGYKMGRDIRQSPRQRASVGRFWRIMVGCLVTFVLFPLLLIIVLQLARVRIPKETLFGALTIWLGMLYVVVPAALLGWAWQRRRRPEPQGTDAAQTAEIPRKPITKWVVTAIIGAGVLFVALLFDTHWKIQALPTVEMQQLINENTDKQIGSSISQYQNGLKVLWVMQHKDGRLCDFTAPADESTLSLLAEKKIACPTYVQGRDFEVLGWPGRHLMFLCIFILAAGSVILLRQPRLSRHC